MVLPIYPLVIVVDLENDRLNSVYQKAIPFPLRQQINKYGCTQRSLLVLSFLRGMVLGGEERR
jgi:hypothetical protein